MREPGERVTGIRPDPRRPDRFLVERDGLPWLKLSAARVVELGLSVGEPLTEERRATIEQAATLDAALDAGLRLLAVRPRSEAELRRRLQQKRFAPSVVEQVLARLRSLGYLDDRAFAESWIRQRRALNPRGASALRRELRSKGVAPELIDACVPDDPVSELAAAREVVEKHRKRFQALDARTAERRLAGVLSRRGFSWSVIRTVLLESGFSPETTDDVSAE
ncbi:MAG: regulatory protein RecX [Thermomicrobium sp.]|nr:regulatory protein RecX [Thermomicrobium sp.]